METVISIPDMTFQAAERFAKNLGISRSEFYTRAISFYLQKYPAEYSVTERLNKIYGKGGENSTLDPVLQQLQFHSFSPGEW